MTPAVFTIGYERATPSSLLAALRAAGAVRPLLTGSGSACFALARTATEARAIAARLAAARGADGTRLWPGVFTVRLVAGRGDGATAPG